MSLANPSNTPSLYLVAKTAQAKFKPEQPLHVLSVGPLALCSMVCDVLKGHNCWHRSARDCREIWRIPTEETIHIAILHQLLFPFEREEATSLIRRRWPEARIVVIRAGSRILDDALYDDRILPGGVPGEILAFIERLTGQRQSARLELVEATRDSIPVKVG
jgi:hypothetical protein